MVVASAPATVVDSSPAAVVAAAFFQISPKPIRLKFPYITTGDEVSLLQFQVKILTTEDSGDRFFQKYI